MNFETYNDQLEEIEQKITLVLHEIDDNFDKCQKILSRGIIPKVSEIHQNSDLIVKAIKPWYEFFATAASIGDKYSTSSFIPSHHIDNTLVADSAVLDKSIQLDHTLDDIDNTDHSQDEKTASSEYQPVEKTIVSEDKAVANAQTGNSRYPNMMEIENSDLNKESEYTDLLDNHGSFMSLSSTSTDDLLYSTQNILQLSTIALKQRTKNPVKYSDVHTSDTIENTFALKPNRTQLGSDYPYKRAISKILNFDGDSTQPLKLSDNFQTTNTQDTMSLELPTENIENLANNPEANNDCYESRDDLSKENLSRDHVSEDETEDLDADIPYSQSELAELTSILNKYSGKEDSAKKGVQKSSEFPKDNFSTSPKHRSMTGERNEINYDSQTQNASSSEQAYYKHQPNTENHTISDAPQHIAEPDIRNLGKDNTEMAIEPNDESDFDSDNDDLPSLPQLTTIIEPNLFPAKIDNTKFDVFSKRQEYDIYNSDSDCVISPPQLTSSLYTRDEDSAIRDTSKLNLNFVVNSATSSQQSIPGKIMLSHTEFEPTVTGITGAFNTSRLPASYSSNFENSNSSAMLGNNLKGSNINSNENFNDINEPTFSEDESELGIPSAVHRYSKSNQGSALDSGKGNFQSLGDKRAAISAQFDGGYRSNSYSQGSFYPNFDETVHMDPKLFEAEMNLYSTSAQQSPLASKYLQAQKNNLENSNLPEGTSGPHSANERRKFESGSDGPLFNQGKLNRIRSSDELSPLRPQRIVRSKYYQSPGAQQHSGSGQAKSQIGSGLIRSNLDSFGSDGFKSNLSGKKVQMPSERKENENSQSLSYEQINGSSFSVPSSSLAAQQSLGYDSRPADAQNRAGLGDGQTGSFEFSSFSGDYSIVSNSSVSQVDYLIDGTTSVYPDTMLLRLAASQAETSGDKNDEPNR
ncbi:hypothetical protein BB560_004577 [Smittium megazygosporum]|uniref:Uncharacterized protein n=1 Tax=Smittium megazygosporum TaxID=133381 RepID=A0A2T9Z8U8_9FUNG|nr:hypothetical protein BB560_004577 [Smittium megazygosporum]